MRYRIEVLTPVHIFDRKLEPFEVAQVKNRLALLSEDTFASLLASAGLVREFCRKASEGKVDVLRFLKDHGLEERVPEAVLRTIEMPAGTVPSNLQIAVTDGTSQEPYIPGSSIKGYLRNAALFSILSDSPDIRSRERARITEAIARAGTSARRKRKLRQEVGKPVDALLQQADLDGARQCDPHTDWLRAVQLTDAHLEQTPSGGATRLYPVGVVSLRRDLRTRQVTAAPKSSFYITVEALKPGTILSGRLKVDPGLLRMMRPRGGTRRPFESLDDLMHFVGTFSLRVLESEVEFYDRFGHPGLARRLERLKGRANLRLGWGGGYLARSVALAFDASFRDLVRDAFHQPRDGFPFPKSQKAIIERDKPAEVLGWARLSIEG